MKKRLISLLLVLGMLAGMLTIGIAEEYSFADDDGTGTWTWAGDYIYDCYEEGIINGYEDGTYLPDGKLTRAEAAKIIAVTFGLSSDASVSSFSDVSADHWALQYIEACVEAGIINGYEDGTFLPGQNVTRAEMAKMIAAAAGLSSDASAGTFSDVSASHWALPYIEACYDAGIITGYEDGTFLPGNNITRAEAAAIISRVLGLMNADEDSDDDTDDGETAEFEEKTTDDFDGLIVINFDDDETSNFMVLAEGTVAAEASGTADVLVSADEDTGTYVIADVSGDISALQAGDVLYYAYGDDADDYILIKVAEITIVDGTATIVAETEDVELSDYFEYVDLDMDVEVTEDCFTPAEEEGITYLGYSVETAEETVLLAGEQPRLLQATLADADETLTGSFKFSLEYDLGDGHSIIGTLKEKVTAHVVFKFNAFPFYLEASLSLGSDTTVSLTYKISGESDLVKEKLMPLGTITFPIAGGVALDGDLYFKVEAKIEATFTAEASFSFELGVGYDSVDGFETNFDGDADAELKTALKGSVFAGITAEYGFSLAEVLEIKVENDVGAELEGTSDLVGISTDRTENHLCPICIDGDLSIVGTASAKIKLLEKSLAESGKAELKHHIFDFYISDYGPEIEFGKGSCPYKSYLVTIAVQDGDGSPISGAAVSIDEEALEDVTDSDGTVTAYSMNGDHTASAEADGYESAAVSFTTKSAAQSIVITLEDAGTGDEEDLVQVSGIVYDTDGNRISGAVITFMQDDSSYEAVADENGHFETDLAEGTYTVAAAADGYESETFEYTTGYMLIIKLEKKSTLSDADIPDDAVEYNGHYYYLFDVDEVTSGAEAIAYCESLGGYLASITTEEEDAFLYAYITSLGYTSAYFGLTDQDEEGTWVWVSGETVDYTNWASGEPNGQNSSEDFAMYYYKYSDGSWNDGDFRGSIQNFLCEWD